jgi:hypothetical protein
LPFLAPPTGKPGRETITTASSKERIMSRNRWTKPIRLIAGLLVGLLFAISAIPLRAQPAPQTRGRGFGPVYDKAHEITVNGSIQMVVTKHVPGSPAGMHLLVDGPEGVVDTHVGSFLSKATKEDLQAGMPVRIVGAMTTERGKRYLLARELTVGNRVVRVRSDRGFLVHDHPVRVRHAATKKKVSQPASNGGAR